MNVERLMNCSFLMKSHKKMVDSIKGFMNHRQMLDHRNFTLSCFIAKISLAWDVERILYARSNTNVLLEVS